MVEEAALGDAVRAVVFFEVHLVREDDAAAVVERGARGTVDGGAAGAEDVAVAAVVGVLDGRGVAGEAGGVAGDGEGPAVHG